MSELGKLYYSLGLDTKQFEQDVNKAEQLVSSLNGKSKDSDIKLSVDKKDVEQALNNVRSLRDVLQQLEKSVTVKILGTTKNDLTVNVSGVLDPADIKMGGGTKSFDVPITGTIVNDDLIKNRLAEKLKDIPIENIKVDPSTLKNALRQQMWNIQVTADASTMGKIVKQIRDYLGINRISINVSPNLSQKDLNRLKKDVEQALKGVSVPVRFTKKNIQDELDKLGKFHIEADVKLNTNTIQSQLNSIKAGLTLSGQNLGGNATGNTALTQRLNLQQRVNQRATDELGIRRAINDQMSRNTMLATMLGNTIGNVFAVYQLQRFLESLINIGGEIQKQRLALGHILDNISNANMLFEQMKQLAVKSPFGLLDLMQNARQLSAFGVEYNNLYDTMKRLSDMSAGLGIQFSRLALAYGETKERGFLDGKLVRQFSYMGLPILQKIAEHYTQIDKLGNDAVVTAAKVRGMVSDKLVSFEDVDAVIQKMTEYGGQFYNMQDVMAESVSGKWKNLKDAIDIMYNEMAEGNSEILKAPAEILTKLTRNYEYLVPVLTAVAMRLAGVKTATALNNMILAQNSTQLLVNKQAQQQNLLSAIKRNGTLRLLSATEKQRLATIQAMSLGEFKQLIRTNQLTKSDAERLIMTKKLNQEQIDYLMRLRLISQAEVDAAMKTNRLMMSIKSLGTTMKGLFSTANIWTLIMMAAGEAWVYFSNKSEKAKEFSNDIKQAADDFRKATSSIQEEVGSLNFDNMSVGERESELKAMVEYIKDNAPDAGRKLNEIFKTDGNGKFVYSMKERFEALQSWIDELERLSLLDLSASNTAMSNMMEAWGVDDAAKDFMKANTETNNMLNNTIFSKRNQQSIKEDLANFKTMYKEGLMDALNITSDKEFESQNLRTFQRLATTNKYWMDKFIETFDIAGVHIQDWQEQYTSSIKKMAQAAHNAFQEMKRQNTDANLNIVSGDGRNIWNRIIDTTIMLKYKDESSDVQQMIRRFMEDPTILAKLQVSSENGNEFVEQLVNDPEVHKKVFLDILPTYNGALSTDPWKDIMTGVVGKIDTSGSAAGNYDDIVKQTKEAYAALENSKKMSKMFAQVKREVLSNGQVMYKAIGSVNKADKDIVKAYANNLTQFENAIISAKNAAQKTGLDWNKIYADAVKAYNKNEHGNSKEDTLLTQLKTQFDEIKKTYNEYEKWAKAIGRKNAGEKMSQLGLIDAATAKELSDPNYYKKKIEAMLTKYEAELQKTEQRKKFQTSLNIEVGAIELNGVNEALQRSKANVAKEINQAAKQYEVWKSWMSATGDSDTALKMSLAVRPIWNEQSTSLLEQLNKNIEGKGIKLSFGAEVDEVAMKKQFDDAGVSAQYDMWKAINDMIIQSGYEYSKNAANAVQSVQTYSEKLKVLNEERNNAIKGANGDLAAKNRINAEYDVKAAELDPTYIQFMTNVFSLTNSAAQSLGMTLKNQLNEQLMKGGIAAEEYQAKIQKINEQMTKSKERIDSYGEAWLLGKVKDYRKSQYDSASATVTANSMNLLESKINLDKLLGDAGASVKEVTLAIQNHCIALANFSKAEKKQYEAKKKYDTSIENDKLNNEVNAFIGKIGEMANAFDFLSESFQNIFGESQGAQTVSSIASSTLQGASTGQQISQALGATGPWGAAAGAAVGLLSGILQVHDKQLQESIEESEARQEKYSNISDRLEEILKNTLGGLDKIELSKSSQEVLYNLSHAWDDDIFTEILSRPWAAIKLQVSEISQLTDEQKQTLTGYSKETVKAAQSARDSGSYLQAQYALLLAQRDEVAEQYSSAQRKKNEDDKQIEEKRNELEQLEIEIKSFYEDIAKDVYEIDFQSFAQQLGDALVDAWAKGESAANAYATTVRDIIKSVVKNVVAQNIVQAALQPAMDDFINAFKTNNGIINADMIVQLSNGIMDGSEKAAIAVNTLLDSLKSQGVNLKESSSSSLGQSIQGVSEETASILAGYVAGLRIDVSIQRMKLEQFIGENTMDNFKSIAETQVSHLKNIANYTLRTAQAVEQLDARVSKVIDGDGVRIV